MTSGRGGTALATALLLAGCGSAPAVAPPPGPPVSALRIGLSEYQLQWSASAVRPGPVELTVTNTGSAQHDVQLVQEGTVIGGSEVLPPGGRQTVQVQVGSVGPISLLCTVAGHVEAGMTGSLDVAGN